MRKITVLAACASMLAIPVIAQMPTKAPGEKDPSRVKAGIYSVEPTHTQILYEVNHLGFSDYFGMFGDPTGTLKLDPAKLEASSVEIEIPIANLSSTSAKLNQHLQAPDFFDAAKYPVATFKSTSVVAKGTHATINGNLTIKGVTKPVVLDAEFIGAGMGPMDKKFTIGFKAHTKVNRSDFGVSYGVPLIPDEVKLTINAAFTLNS